MLQTFWFFGRKDYNDVFLFYYLYIMKPFVTCLWFNGNGMEATEYYTNIFPNSSLWETVFFDESNPHWITGSVMTVEFSLNGIPFVALNGGPEFQFTPATSFIISCKDQEEIDFYYRHLSAVPEAEVCGWVTDKFWVSWQIVPENLKELMRSPKAMEVLLGMKRFDIAQLEALMNIHK